MSSGIYRPRLFEDGLVLPNASGPMTKDSAQQKQQLRRHQSTDSHSGGERKQLQQPTRDAAIPRIESLPIIQNGSSQRGKQRKMAFIKAGRNKHGGFISEGYSGSYHPVIEAGEDGTSQRPASESFPDRDPAVQKTSASSQQLSSPVNRSGIDILIDGGSDVECADDDASKKTPIGSDKDNDDTRTEANGKSVCDDLLVDIEPVTPTVNLADQSDVCESTSYANSRAAQTGENGDFQAPAPMKTTPNTQQLFNIKN